MSNGQTSKKTLAENPRPGSDTPLAHRKSGYSLAGCFPAEPASASPDDDIQAESCISMQPLDIGTMPWKIPPVSGHPPK